MEVSREKRRIVAKIKKKVFEDALKKNCQADNSIKILVERKPDGEIQGFKVGNSEWHPIKVLHESHTERIQRIYYWKEHEIYIANDVIDVCVNSDEIVMVGVEDTLILCHGKVKRKRRKTASIS